MLRFVNQARVTFNWQEELLEGPEENQLLEKLGLCVAEWFQPEDQDLESQCTAKLDEIAWRIKEELRVTNPEHLLFKVPESVQNQWRTKMLPDNEFDVTHSQEILRCALQVMVSTLEFTRDNYDPEKFNNEVICLNKVNKYFNCIKIIERVKEYAYCIIILLKGFFEYILRLPL